MGLRFCGLTGLSGQSLGNVGERAVSYRVNRPLPSTVRLWTLQPILVWEELRQHGSLYVDPVHHSDVDDFQKKAYEWLREQTAQRIPGYRGHYPWWANDFKLDLRSQRKAFGKPGERYVRLELAVPQEQVLLSAYGAWHCVLNRWYLPYATDPDGWDQESAAWEAELTVQGIDRWSSALPEPYHSRMVASWNRIFDADDLRETNTIQATFERLALENVVTVTEYIVQKSSWRSGE